MTKSEYQKIIGRYMNLIEKRKRKDGISSVDKTGKLVDWLYNYK